MKLFTITILITLISCTEKKSETKITNSKDAIVHHKVSKTKISIDTIAKSNSKNEIVHHKEPKAKASIDTIAISKKADSVSKEKNITNKKEGIPADGTYVYDIAYSEWQGRSMGEKVKVIIVANTIKIYAIGKSSTGVKNGELIDQGMLVKHNVTGDWLITQNPSDANLEVYGGCVGAPMVIDFVNKKYWTC